jgi:hypothetical protein
MVTTKSETSNLREACKRMAINSEFGQKRYKKEAEGIKYIKIKGKEEREQSKNNEFTYVLFSSFFFVVVVAWLNECRDIMKRDDRPR